MDINTFKHLNKVSTPNRSLEFLQLFLGNNSFEVYFAEEGVFKTHKDFIKLNEHLVDKIDGIKVEVFAKEHSPAHFHVKIAEYEASYTIKDCSLMQGNLPKKYEKKVLFRYKYGGKENLVEIRNQTRLDHCPAGKI